MNEPTDLSGRLNVYYQQVSEIILARQNPVTGLLPASTAVNAHGDYRDAWVRDNVYSILAAWGLALAYRKLDDDGGRGYELEHAVVKLMRGLLFAMMRQTHKVEAFKVTQDPLDALHAKYSTATGDTVTADDGWGHLQIDATSLYLLMLAQMTASGLTIIYTQDEVNFIQNLVFYIGRAYRTPDYGVWERGDKTNHGLPELNASSVAMAKAALEALSNFNLFGVRGAQPSVIHVLPDEIARARITLEALLPRESSSKEVDAALLGAISFPAFAVEDRELIERTRERILAKLDGRYGLKRFLRDGHQTVLEASERLHYEPEELKQFEHLESEWPLFFTYLVLDGIFFGRPEQVAEYRERLDRVSVQRGSHALLPELYYVPEDAVEAERAEPGSQQRLPNDNVPLVWAQSLHLLGGLLSDELLSVFDIDPLGRHQQLDTTTRPVVQLALVTEDAALQETLAERGVRSQTLQQIRPVQLRSAADLAKAYFEIGRNDKLGLSGRPVHRLLTLSTSRIFRLAGEWIVCPPAFFDQKEFYLSLDPHFLAGRVKSELSYVHRYWSSLGRPTLTFLLTRGLLDTGRDAFFGLVDELRGGAYGEIPVKLAPMNLLMQTANLERIDNLHDLDLTQVSPQPEAGAPQLQFSASATHPLRPEEELEIELEPDPATLERRLTASKNLYEQSELLTVCAQRFGLNAELGGSTVAGLLEEVYTAAGELKLWAVVRRAAGLLGKVDVSLSDSLMDILVRQKALVIGKAYSERSLISRPLPQSELLAKIDEFCRDDIRDRVLTQELLIYLSLLMRSDPELFQAFTTLRVGYLILLLVSDLTLELGMTQDECYECLMHLPPSEIQERLKSVLLGYSDKEALLEHQEFIVKRSGEELSYTLTVSDAPPPEGGWWLWRQREGVLSGGSPAFFARVWQLMSRCRGLVIGDKLERRNRLESRILLAEMTPGEQKFALRVEHLLNKIPSPEYRQLNTEALNVLSSVFEQNPDLTLSDYLVLDVIIGHAVRLAYLKKHPERAPRYSEDKAAAWADFYALAPQQTSGYLVLSLKFLLSGEEVAA